MRPKLFPLRIVTALLLAGPLLAGCSSSWLGGSSKDDALKDLKWSYAADGVQIAVRADPQLNRSDGQPHTLALTVIQLADPSAFTPYTKDPAKLAQLLLANSAPTGVLSLQRFFIAPNAQQTLVLPRAENAKYVGLATGYYHLDPPRDTRLYRIGVDVDSSGFLVKNHSAAPAPMKIDLILGADSILDAPDTRPPEVPPTQPKAGVVSSPPAPSDKASSKDGKSDKQDSSSKP
ncbi:type VI secretion lipoprotein TssJ [Candidimonas nitroreducens]|uniref:Type VI secretion system-associated lipoprotein n=1 Tax=Candidimonas nitroreducens TaxID=683354 RepID=A0A225ME97_9BURK|nr:type VI secretion lipoprotein TssJ [Candidimonas nitroreducens]OWT59102.1 type VI secretion system-associated lipoprotein [Candidimonas nitroreducens]